MGSDSENRLGDQETGSQGRLFSSELQVSGEPGHCRARTNPICYLPAAGVLPSICPSIVPAEMSNIRR